MSVNRCQSRFCLFSERSYAYSSRPGEAVDEGALQAVQRSGGRLRARPRGEDHHLHWPAGILGHGLLPGECLIRREGCLRRVSETNHTRNKRLILFYFFAIFQVEDVNKKFNALKEAESRGWVEEHKPLLRQKKVVKVRIFEYMKLCIDLKGRKIIIIIKVSWGLLYMPLYCVYKWSLYFWVKIKAEQIIPVLSFARNHQLHLPSQQEPKEPPSLAWLQPKQPWKPDNRQRRQRKLKRMLVLIRTTPAPALKNRNPVQNSEQLTQWSLMEASSRWRAQPGHQVRGNTTCFSLILMPDL